MERMNRIKNEVAFVYSGKVLHLAESVSVWSRETTARCGKTLVNVKFEYDSPFVMPDGMKRCPTCFANYDFNAINARMAEIEIENQVIDEHNERVSTLERASREAAKQQAIQKFRQALEDAGFTTNDWLAQVEIDGNKFSFEIRYP